MVKNDPNIHGVDILGFVYLLTAYADDASFIVKSTDSICAIFRVFDAFSEFAGLKVNR